jgi:hypothetical protein
MAIKHYLVELATEVAVTVNDDEVTQGKTLYQLVFDKTQAYIDNFIETDEQFLMKIVAEDCEQEEVLANV